MNNSPKYMLQATVMFSDDKGVYDQFVIAESDDLFLLVARLENMKKAESSLPLAQDFRTCRQLKELAREHQHPNYPCKLLKTGKYSCGELA